MPEQDHYYTCIIVGLMAIGTLSGAAMGFIDYGPLGLLAGGVVGLATVPAVQIGLAINAYRSTQSKKSKK